MSKVHENCKSKKCGSNELCNRNTTLRMNCKHHTQEVFDGERCRNCKYLRQNDEGEFVCLKIADVVDIHSYCHQWAHRG